MLRKMSILAVLLAVVASACTLGGSAPEPIEPTEVAQDVTEVSQLTKPEVQIISPNSGDTFNVNEEVLVSVRATDTVGVTSLRLFANNQIVNTVTSSTISGSKDFPTVLNYTPRAAGTVTLQVQAFRGSVSSDPEVITITVQNQQQFPTPIIGGNTGGTTGGNTSGGNTSGGSGSSGGSNQPQIPNDGVCRALTTVNLRMRSEPDTSLDNIITVLPQNTLVPVLGRLGDNSWWKVNNGSSTGWVSASFTTLYGNCLGVPIEQAPVVVPTPVPTQSQPTGFPDLSITGLSGEQFPVISQNSSSVTQSYSITITNLGNVASGAFNVQSSTSNRVANIGQVANLNPGESTTLTANWTFDREQDYTVQAQVDSASQVRESNESNNVAAIQVRVSREVPGFADLRIVNLQGNQSPNIRQNQSAVTESYSFTVTNSGNQASGAFNVVSTLGSQRVTVGQISGLNPSESFSMSTNWTFDQSGSFIVEIRADGNNEVNEGNENNNNASLQVNVTKESAPAPADLELSAINGNQSPQIPDRSNAVSETYRIRVTNRGSGPSGRIQVNSELNGETKTVGEVNSLGPGESRTFDTEWLFQGAGSYQVRASVVALDGNDTNGNNNSSSLQVNVAQPQPTQFADLIVSSVIGNQSPRLSGNSVSESYNVTITNVGNENSGAFSVNYRMAGENVDFAQIQNLQPGQSQTLTLVLTFFEAREYAPRIQADSANQVNESNEDNNVFQIEVNVGIGNSSSGNNNGGNSGNNSDDNDEVPGNNNGNNNGGNNNGGSGGPVDLQITRIRGNQFPVFGNNDDSKREEYTLTIRNTSTGTSPSFEVIAIVNGGRDDVGQVPALGPNQSAELEAEFTIENELGLVVEFIVDPNNRVLEVNDDNNIARLFIHTVQQNAPNQPDLVIVDMQEPGDFDQNPVYVVTVQNIGGSRSGQVEMLAIFGSNEESMGRVNNVPPNQTRTFELDANLVSNEVSRIDFFVDPRQDVDEISEDNNRATMTLRP